ncbi:MAG: transglutaminase-like domain-containing protein [Planctomycetota bacterium]
MKLKPRRKMTTLPTILLLAAGLVCVWLFGCAMPRITPGPSISHDALPSAFLQPTAAIDSGSQTIRNLAAQVTQGATSDRDKAVAIHDFVRDQIPFGWQESFYENRASEVLAARIGYCNTKSTLFIALLRAAGIPARQHFVDIDARLLRGIIDPGTPYVDHSFTEVYLEDTWVQTDSYIVDRAMFEAARVQLAAAGWTIGYGIHASGTSSWDGTANAFSQFADDGSSARFTTRDYGVHSDVLTFYRDEEHTWNALSPPARLFIRFGLSQANKAVQRLRGGGS